MFTLAFSTTKSPFRLTGHLPNHEAIVKTLLGKIAVNFCSTCSEIIDASTA